MVRRFRSGLNLRPVNRVKHVVDIQGATAGGTQATNNIILAVDNPVITTAIQVQTASTVNAIFLKVEVVNSEVTQANLPNAYLTVFKNPGSNLTIPVGNVVGVNDNKKYVIHQEMVMLEKATGGNPRTLFVGVIMIPKGYRRFSFDDSLQIGVFSPGIDLEFCIQVHYKEFR